MYLIEKATSYMKSLFILLQIALAILHFDSAQREDLLVIQRSLVDPVYDELEFSGRHRVSAIWHFAFND